MSHQVETSRYARAVASLPHNRPESFVLTPNRPECAALAEELGLTALRKLRFEGEIRSRGKRDWVLEGTLGATVVQPCVQTLEPVTTRIDQPVERHYLAEWQDEAVGGAEIEMPEDVTSEPLEAHIDPWVVMVEALALALPDYPRAEDAPPLGEVQVTEPGKTPLRDEDVKPFAGLAALKAQMKGDGD